MGAWMRAAFRYTEHRSIICPIAELNIQCSGGSIWIPNRSVKSLLALIALNDFPFTLIEPATVLDEAPKWEKLWNELFLTK